MGPVVLKTVLRQTWERSSIGSVGWLSFSERTRQKRNKSWFPQHIPRALPKPPKVELRALNSISATVR
jgi:hypothetical protein